MLPTTEAAAAVVSWAHQRRRHRRSDLCFQVQFSILPDHEALQALEHVVSAEGPGPGPGGDPGQVYVQNLSQGGLGLCGALGALRDRVLREGDCLRMEIRSPRASEAIRCLGTVAWVRLHRVAGLFRAGVAFVGVDAADLARMECGDPKECGDPLDGED